MMEGYVQGALRMDLYIAPSALKQVLCEILTDSFYQYFSQNH